MKKILSLICAAVLLCANVNADQAVTINYGGNATQSHFPIYGDNADSEGHKVQAIYLADQLNGTQAGCIMATDAEVRIQFVAYDDEKAASGYRYGYYTGQFRLVGQDGNTYFGKFMELFCNSYNYSTAGSSIRDHKGMWDEDPDYVVPGDGGQGDKDGLEQIEVSKGMNKVLMDGTLYIVRDGAIYTVTGVRVK